ncbi:MAG: hypothetical protein IBX49_10955, partial [Gammaproteobacteria bacterium]|nr:hypothetical protein [Gammaproteobacteria bacterium]
MMHIEYHEDGTVTLRGEAGAAEPHATLRVTNRRTGETITVTVGADGSFSATLRAEAGDELEIVVIDRAGNQSEKQNLTVGAASGQLPPDPASIAPPLDPTGFTSLLDATEFLYTGANPIQRDVAPGTIEARRAAVIRGRVQTRDGQALSGVTITLQGHPELGHTLSRADGMFDMVVNGGGLMVINYERDGYLPAQRKVKTPWQDYVWAEDVALIPLDPNATEITLGAAHMQVAQGSVEQDEDGQRQATILFPAGTQAELVMPDGTRQPLTSATVRATEYTVGPNGPKAMPGELPPTTAYTYAVELSLDEAIAVGAKEVRFDRPVFVYVDNFLDFPVGGIVPAGWYDRDKAAWIPSDNGRVIQILAIENGQAVLDVDGSGQPASPEALAVLNITEEERSQLAALYPAGHSLWRTPVEHFTPWDCNWPYGPPEDAVAPESEVRELEEKDDEPDCQPGSIIECQNQVVRQSIPVTGTPFSLNYRSDRVPGRQSAYHLTIPVSGNEPLPASVARIEMEVWIAGQQHRHSFPAQPNQNHSFVWDGKDGFGRRVLGSKQAKVRIGYVYKAVYYEPSSFANAFGVAGTNPIEGDRDNSEVILWQESQHWLGVDDARSLGLGGWSITPQHSYEPNAEVLWAGDGTRRSAGLVSDEIQTI